MHHDLVRAPARGHGGEALFERAPLLLVEAHELAEELDVLRAHELRRDVDLVSRSVRGDDAAAGVADDAARGREDDRLGDVRARGSGPLLALDDLQLGHPEQEEAERREDEERHPLVTLLEFTELASRREKVHASAPPSSRLE